MHQRTMEVAAKAEPSSGLHRFPQVLHIIRRQRRPVQHVGPDPQRRPQRLLAPPLGNTAMIARTQHIRHGNILKDLGPREVRILQQTRRKTFVVAGFLFPHETGDEPGRGLHQDVYKRQAISIRAWCVFPS